MTPSNEEMRAVVDQDRYVKYLDALLSGNRTVCSGVIAELLEQETPILEIYEQFFRRSLYDVGSRWEHGEISVAVEHMATAITERLLAEIYPRIFQADHVGRSAVITCAPGELHQIGARMVADAFELNGWDGYFLGADTPEADLLSMVRDKRPDIVAVSVSLPTSLSQVYSLMEKLLETFPSQNVIVGGQGFTGSRRDVGERFPGVRLLTSLDELRTFLAKF